MVLILGLGSLAPSGWADGVVEGCNAEALEAALSTGGTVTFGCSGTITLTRTLKVSADTVVDGAGQQVTLDGGDAVRIFEVRGTARLTLRNLKLTRGRHVGAGGDGNPETEDGRGGAVWVEQGGLIASNCVFSGNTAKGGKASGGNGGYPGGGRGGAISVSDGSLELVACTLDANLAQGGDNLTRNSAGSAEVSAGRGGAVYHERGQVRIVGTRFEFNRAEGSGLAAPNFAMSTGSSFGGAVYAGLAQLAIEESQFVSNLVVTPNAPRNVSAGETGGGAVFVGEGPTVASVRASSFVANRSPGGWGWDSGGEGRGGAIATFRPLRCEQTQFISNQANGGISTQTRHPAKGGAVWSVAEATLVSCTFTSNSALGAKGWGTPGSGSASQAGTEALGGAMFIAGSAVIQGTAFSANSAVGGGGQDIPGFPATGAGSGNGGALYGAAALALVNCTLHNNSAVAGAQGFPWTTAGSASGGGVYLAAGPFGGTNLTLVGNRVLPNTGGGELQAEAIFVSSNSVDTVLVNSILAQNGTVGEVEGSVTVFRSNLTASEPDPRLGEYGEHGGPTFTVPLLIGSPAIDAADASSCPPTDQRGVTRPFGAGCDLGAFELGSETARRIVGWIRGMSESGGTTVSAGQVSVAPDSSGFFAIEGLSSGTYSVAPASTAYRFRPESAEVVLGEHEIRQDFRAYRIHSIAAEREGAGPLQIVYAGKRSAQYAVEISTDLAVWTRSSTNQTGADGLMMLEGSGDPGISGSRFLRVFGPLP